MRWDRTWQFSFLHLSVPKQDILISYLIGTQERKSVRMWCSREDAAGRQQESLAALSSPGGSSRKWMNEHRNREDTHFDEEYLQVLLLKEAKLSRRQTMYSERFSFGLWFVGGFF